MDDENSTLKSIGAIVLTLALFLGVGWYVYSALFVTPAPQPQDEIVAVHTQQAPAQPVEKTTTQNPG
ncbi:MAG TPA: hypothetical protein VMU01_10480 [Rhizomicrobium sp.]|nr:hypothetical protein [Rhizomicrobium sp.]